MGKINLGANWIRKIEYDPCDPNPWIYIELAFPAIIQAIWEYIQWDWEDYIEHGTGKTWQKRAKKQVKANKWQPPKAASRGIMFLFLAEAGVQRFLWMFLVAEIAVNAFIRWSSLIMNLPECNTEIRSIWGRSESPLDGRPLHFDWQRGPAWALEEGTMFPYIQPNFVIPPGGAAMYCTFQRYANFITGEELVVKTRLVRLRDGYPIDEAPPNDPTDDNKRSSAMVGKIKNDRDFPEEYEFQVQLGGGQFPLVWACIGDFCSLRIFEPYPAIPTISMPYTPLEQPKRRTAQPRKRGAPI